MTTCLKASTPCAQAVPRLAELSRSPCGELRTAALSLLASLSEEPACCEALAAPLTGAGTETSAFATAAQIQAHT